MKILVVATVSNVCLSFGFPSTGTVSLQINVNSTPVSSGTDVLSVLVCKVRSFSKQSEIFMVQAKIKEDQFHKKFCLNDS
jgi:hypothetical protein